MSENLSKLIESAGEPPILVVGDLILDCYVWGQAARISPEGPIPVLQVTSDEFRPGGAGNVASALAHLGAKVSICGVVGNDREGVALTHQLESLCRARCGVFVTSDRPTTVKTRYIGYVQSARRGIQHMLRVDREQTHPISAQVERDLLNFIAKALPCYRAVVLSDYDKGVLTEKVLSRTIQLAQKHGIPVITDPKIGRSYTVYRGSTVLTPNRLETQMATGISPIDAESRRAAGAKLIRTAALRYAVITLDRDGMYLLGADEPGILIASRPREVFDVTGAGDMVVSVLALMLAAKASIQDAVRLANVAAGIEVAKIGAAPVSRSEIMGDLISGDSMKMKLKSIEEAAALADETRRRNAKVVWTNGCFDILHIGHYEYLRGARRLGDLLVVGLNSDVSVRRLKGPSRPITGEAERARILAALDVVDCVVIFDEDTPIEAIKTIRPDIIAKGGDYTENGVVGHELVESYGGRVEILPLIEGVSTTDIVRRVLERYGSSKTSKVAKLRTKRSPGRKHK